MLHVYCCHAEWVNVAAVYKSQVHFPGIYQANTTNRFDVPYLIKYHTQAKHRPLVKIKHK